MTNSKEKRKHVRIDSLNLSYLVVDEDNKPIKQGMGRTLNVSESGLLLETHFPIEMGLVISLTIGLEDDMMEIKGKVVYSKVNTEGKFETGIEFSDQDETMLKKIKTYITAFNRHK